MGRPLQNDSLFRDIRAFVARRRLLEGVRRVFAGFSGGADSTALLLALQRLGAPGLTAVHIHHGLRGAAADADAGWCRDFCAGRGIPFLCEHVSVPACRRPGEGVEEAARRCRLAVWRRLAGETADSGAVVALGHHVDDALEDLLLRLARGANASGLTGLRAMRELDGVRVIRPLLGVRREELEAWLRSQGVAAWREDASNRDETFRRNAVRRRWLPLIRETVGHDRGLQASLAALERDADFLEREAAAEFIAVQNDASRLAAVHPALLPRVLRLWLRRETGADLVPAQAAVERLRRALAAAAPRAVRIPLGGGRMLAWSPRTGLRLSATGACAELPERLWHWRKQPVLEVPEAGVELRAETASPPRLTPAPIPTPQSKLQNSAECFAGAALPEVLTVRGWRPGDRIRPFGAAFTKKLQDLFVDAKVPRERRRLLAVVLAGEDVIWVPGVCRAEFGRVPPGKSGAVHAPVRLRHIVCS